ncbi:molecular chaperone [Erythrobacter sp. NFXS35]|uniref:fimbria/pilus periplasmic chaperone n=1 Tax=Erythrobacter sp. NFXS35 TaxID=2818436 RepID=UPI0032DF8239
MFGWLRGILAILVCLSLAAQAQASRVSPMIVELEPTGTGSIARIDLVNDGLRDIPYEVQMMRGVITPEGQLELNPADEEFLVFPAQAMIESNSQQVFRIQYVGEGALDRSELYYMAIRQIPVAFEPGVTEVQMVVNYNVLVNVVPRGSAPEPVVVSARAASRTVPGPQNQAAPDEDATPIEQLGVEIELSNAGNRFFLAGLSRWSITGDVGEAPFSQSYKGDEASRIIGVGVVAPGATRKFFFPTDAGLDPASVRVTVAP